MNLNQIKAADIITNISFKIKGEERIYIPIKSNNILVWKSWQEEKESQNENSINSINLMIDYLKTKFGMTLNSKLGQFIIFDATLPEKTTMKEKKLFENILTSFFQMAGFSIDKKTDILKGNVNIHEYFEYLGGMNKEELVKINVKSDEEKIKKAEQLIFSFSENLWTPLQIKERVKKILNLEVDFSLINPAKRDDNRHPYQWFLDLINHVNLRRWKDDYDGGYGEAGNWIHNAIAMAIEILPYLPAIDNLQLDGHEYKPDLKYGQNHNDWIISNSKDNKDMLDILTNPVFTEYNFSSAEEFLFLFEHILANCTLTKNKASELSYGLMTGDHHGSSVYESRFTDLELERSYKALIKATPNFTKKDIGWRIKNIEKCPNTLAMLNSLLTEVKSLKKSK